MKWLMYYLIVVNLLTWIIYGIDKWKAKATCVENTGENTVAFWRLPVAAQGHWQDADVPAQDKKTEIHD